MKLSKRQQREKDTRKKRINWHKKFILKRQLENRTFHYNREVQKIVNPGVTIRNTPKEAVYEDQESD